MDTDRAHLPLPLAEDRAEDRAAGTCPPSSAQSGRLFTQVEVHETGKAALGSECSVLVALETAPQQAECRSSPHFLVAAEVSEGPWGNVLQGLDRPRVHFPTLEQGAMVVV